METSTMGSVLVTAKIESLSDLHQLQLGTLPAAQVRRVEVTDALVDTGATMLSMPKRLIDQLSLYLVCTRRARGSAGPVNVRIYSAVRLTILERDCTTEVAEVPDDHRTLIGRITLRLLDFIADPAGRRLIGNPAHGGEHMLDMF